MCIVSEPNKYNDIKKLHLSLFVMKIDVAINVLVFKIPSGSSVVLAVTNRVTYTLWHCFACLTGI